MQMSLKFKIILLGVGGIVSLAIVSLLFVGLFASKIGEFEDLEKQDFVAEEKMASLALDFKRQVQEWKNVLIRGHNISDRDKYWGRFNELQNEIQSRGKDLSAKVRLPSAKQKLDKFLLSHANAYGKYRQGYQVYVDGGEDFRAADQAMHQAKA